MVFSLTSTSRWLFSFAINKLELRHAQTRALFCSNLVFDIFCQVVIDFQISTQKFSRKGNFTQGFFLHFLCKWLYVILRAKLIETGIFFYFLLT